MDTGITNGLAIFFPSPRIVPQRLLIIDDELRHTAPGRLGNSNSTPNLSSDGHSVKRRKDEHGQAIPTSNVSHPTVPPTPRTPTHSMAAPQSTEVPQHDTDATSSNVARVAPPRIPETPIQPTASPHLAGAPQHAAAPIQIFQGCASESRRVIDGIPVGERPILRDNSTSQKPSRNPFLHRVMAAPQSTEVPQHDTVATSSNVARVAPPRIPETPIQPTASPYLAGAPQHAAAPIQIFQGCASESRKVIDGIPVGERPILRDNSTSQKPSRNPFLQQKSGEPSYFSPLLPSDKKPGSHRTSSP